MKIVKKCELCGKNFESDTAVDFNICDDKHIYKCSNCGKDVYVTRNKEDFYKRKMISEQGIIFCDNKCSIQYNQKKKFMDRWKNIIPDIKRLYETTNMQVKDIMQKYNISQSTWKKIVERFDLVRPDNIKKSIYSNKSKKQVEKLKETEKFDEYREKQSNIMKEYWKNIDEKDKQSRIEKTKQNWKLKTPEEKANFSKKINEGKQNMTEEDRNRYRKNVSNSIKIVWKNRTNSEKYEIWALGQETKHNSSQEYCKSFDNILFDSSYEKYVYEFCKRNNIPFERQVPIEFEYKNEKHITYIDFNIDGYYFECKGGHLLQGIYDYKAVVPTKYKLELYKQNHVIIITDVIGSKIIPHKESKESNGLKYLDKCANPLIGVDISLFINPKFPYRNDRPKCFYDVKVNGEKSIKEAFDDEMIRWKMIKNRINYVGGFIDNKEILNAMNVTRTCKQPSWFSKQYAKDLIKKYITTDIILDPFAGWGTRCDACKDLGKKYYGWDLNKDLVDWHEKQGRLFKTGCGIREGNAENIKRYESNCSVFICPPYQNVEIYFKGQNIEKTQCQWLETIIKNIPNAKEYLMVCKIVDKGWEKYIVEEKVNKSHFGTNKEYVLLIKNNKE